MEVKRLGAAAALLAALAAGGPVGAGPLVFYIHAYTGGPKSHVLPLVNLWDSTRALDDGGKVMNRVPDGTRVEVLASTVRGRDLFFFVKPQAGTSGWLRARFIRATPTPQPGALNGLPAGLWPLADTAHE
ncbi:MAG: hypothetical protein HY575_09685 [candidate division NC10 bacterium]|nr:hypothetical protein [candidate division NC10 bacterium]MBI4392146.1 hypothetical protein [candidate division NC10 bacterium]